MADSFDPRYEFNAPRFVDFSLIKDGEFDDPDVEKYFEFDHENGVPVDLGFDPPKPKRAKAEGTSQAPRRSLRNTPARQAPAVKDSPNEVYATPRANPKGATPVRKDKTPTEERRNTLTLVTPSQPKHRPRTRSMGTELQQTPRHEPTKTLNNSADVHKAPSNLCTSLSEWNKKKKPVAEKSPKHTRTLPLKAVRTKSTIKSSEQQELEKIKALREEVEKRRRMAQKSHKRAFSSSSHQAARSVQPLTKVEEFAFATDKRVHDHKPPTGTATEHKKFTSMLRQYEPVKAQRKGPTIPLDSSLYTRKRKHTEEVSKASEAPGLWSKTPERFHSLPRNAKYMPSNKRRRSISMSCKITVPITPKLECKKRARPTHTASQKDLEDKEVEEIKSYRFRARPLNEKIFENRYIGVPRKPPKEPTVAVSPNFATERRIQLHHANKEDTKDNHSFHARPIPKGMFEAPLGIREVASQPLTEAKSPAFALKNRLRSANLSDHSMEDDHVIRANPVPDLNKKFEVKIQRSIVRTEPFSFEQRDQHKKLRKQQLIREEEIKMAEKMRQFRARDPEVLRKEPFIPKASSLPLTDVTDVRLNTELRNSERSQWEAMKADNERLLAQAKAEEERRRQEEEKREVGKMRKQAVHRAQPVRVYQPVRVQKSTVPLTAPQSPRFSSRLRDRSTHL